ncbi:MAG: hypothetical protein HKN25_07760 [Pyrinomonadaceae bacterium]|nr:hypothetical protein [Pyrinomonadaceae bacterium]
MKIYQYKTLLISCFATLIFVWGSNEVFPQNGKLVRDVVHGKSLENTVTRENPDRSVSIYLPPSYEKDKNRRYPVIYLLHGIGDTDRTWSTQWTDDGDKPIPYSGAPDIMNRGIAAGKFGEMIIVMPDQRTKMFGSWYVNSSVTGNWEDFTVKELVSYVDQKYRTLSEAKHRGLAGHSMGGYGAITIGMKHPEVFSVIYALNPAIIDWAADITINTPAFYEVLTIKSADELLQKEFYVAGTVSVAQAFSPNPNNPPFYCDFPFKVVNGKRVPSEPGFSKWQEHSPINMVKKYRSNLVKLRGLRFDSGYEDEFKFIPPNSRAFSSELTNHGVEHIFEEYNGDHRNRLPGKRGRIMTELLPYFWDLLRP